MTCRIIMHWSCLPTRVTRSWAFKSFVENFCFWTSMESVNQANWKYQRPMIPGHLCVRLALFNWIHWSTRKMETIINDIDAYTYEHIEWMYKSMRSSTKKIASRAARARISAQETTPGHATSSLVLASSITSNRLKSRLGPAIFSVLGLLIRTEVSQPCTKQSGKCILNNPGATVGLDRKWVWTVERTMDSARGHVFE